MLPQKKRLVSLIIVPLLLAGCASTDDSKVKTNSAKPPANTADVNSLNDLRQQKMIFFTFDNSTIQPKYIEVLKAHAKYLTNHPDDTIKIEGHCDERGTPEYNIALGERRAKATMKYLQNLGVSKKQMTTISYGEEKPYVDESNSSAYAQNRRAVIVY
jgi:peptidoglycan-associated lipoprotein